MCKYIDIPIIIVHKGDSFYLSPVLKQIRLFNPDSHIYLLSDDSTSHYKNVIHRNVSDYSDGANMFKKVYSHMSINPYDYELFCFQRWFIIRDFVKKEKLDYFLCLDSDVLLYCNVNEVFSKFIDYDFTICKVMGPCFSLFKSSSIEKLCSYMTSLYTDKNHFSRLVSFYDTVKGIGGVCDMTALTWYQQDVSDNVLDLIHPVNGACFDGNISDPMGFEMLNRRKRIYWKNDLPYGLYLATNTYVKFYGLHLQGGAKHDIYKYILDENKKHRITIMNFLKWKFSYKRLLCRYNEVKKMFSSYNMFWLMINNKFKIKQK